MTDLGTYAGLAVCLIFIFAVTSAERLRPKANRFCCLAVLCIWFWATSVWATSTKRLLATPGSEHYLAASCWWLTMMPHMLSCCPLVVVVLAQEGVDVAKKQFLPLFQPSWKTLGWYIAGGCYFYGQLFTVLALTGASPLVVMVVKALEPLVTATLAIFAIGQEVQWSLLVGILVACTGIVLAIIGCPEGHHQSNANPGHHTSLQACIIGAFLANLGFGSRACMVKLAYARGQVQPLIAISTITITGVVIGLLPVLLCPSVRELPWRPLDDQLPMTGVASTGGLWFAAAASYLAYQTASLFLLEAFAVESHALLVAVKHVFTALTATLMVGESLTPTTLTGSAVLLVGIGLYSVAPHRPPDALTKPKSEVVDPEAIPLLSGKTVPAVPVVKRESSSSVSEGVRPPNGPAPHPSPGASTTVSEFGDDVHETELTHTKGPAQAGLESAGMPVASVSDKPPLLLLSICLLLATGGIVVLGLVFGQPADKPAIPTAAFHLAMHRYATVGPTHFRLRGH